MKIRTQFLLVVLVLSLGGYLLLADWISTGLYDRYREALEEPLVDTAWTLAGWIEAAPRDGLPDLDRLRAGAERVRRANPKARIYGIEKNAVDLRVYLTDASGIVLFDSDDHDEGADYSQWNNIILVQRGEYGVRSTRADPSRPESAVLHVSAPVHAGDQLIGIVTVAKPVVNAHVFLKRARMQVQTAAWIAIGTVLVLGLGLAVWITRPIHKLTAYAQDVRDGKRGVRPHIGPRELNDMGAALEEMRTALEGKRYIERYVQALTHELKSPLSAVCASAELIDDAMPSADRQRFLSIIQSEAERLQKIIERLLALASLENRRSLRDVEPVALAELLASEAGHGRTAGEARRVTVQVDVPASATLEGERFVLEHAVGNLIANAVAFSPDGGQVQVSAERQGAYWDIVVTDDGQGLPAYALLNDKAFERFFSLPRPTSGEKSSGLGLAFVREAATLHGGRAWIENRLEGGARACLRLPISQGEHTDLT